jgi:hypothetical protein
VGGEVRRRWPGGYVHTQADGRDVFVIEREVRGKRFHVSTRTHSLRAAMKHLERFEADPRGYRPEGVAGEEALTISAELLDGFYEWQRAKGTTRKHAKEVGHRLGAWMEDLAGVDLRRMSLRDHVIPALDARKTMRGARISSLKAFMGWLRKERHLLTSAQDCTLDLPVPQAIPEKRIRRKAVPLETLQAVLPCLAPPYADALTVVAATGWHWTELARFIKEPASEIVYARRGDTLAVLVTLHKGREYTRVPVKDPDVLAAAERLRQRGRVPKKHNDALRAACRAAGVAEFKWGVMRHTAGTLFVEMGASGLAASEYLGHKDKRTFKRFYEDVAIPTTSVPTPKLRVVKGEG